MYEINVLTNWTILAFLGRIPWIEQGTFCATSSYSTNWTISTFIIILLYIFTLYIYIIYVEVIRTPISKYQKFMTYLLVYNIFKCIYIIIWVVRLELTWVLTHLVLSETCLPIPAYPYIYIYIFIYQIKCPR
jgi:hypothetical protein